MQINELVDSAHENALSHGWWDPRTEAVEVEEDPQYAYSAKVPRSFGEVIALIHSEASEALEAHRDGNDLNRFKYSWTIPADFPYEVRTVGDDEYRVISSIGTDAYMDHEEFLNLLRIHRVPLKPEGVPSEMADLVIRVADACGRYGIDLEKAIAEKMEYNLHRPRLHGRAR